MSGLTVEQLRTRIAAARKKGPMHAVAVWPDEADEIARRLDAYPNWIAVTNRLPDADMEVDVATSDGEVFAAIYDGDGCWRDLTAWPLAAGRVTHWADKRAHPGDLG